MVSTNGARVQPRAKAITAAARAVGGPKGLSAALLNRATQGTQGWQTAAWNYFDDVPEVHFGHEFLGNAVSQCRIFPQFASNPTDPPIPLDPEDTELDGDVRKAAAVAAATLDRLDASIGGIGGLIGGLGLNTALVGEVYLWGHQDSDSATGETWEAVSTREVRVTGDEITVSGDGSTGEAVEKVATADYFVRIWRRHPAWRLRADSPMRSLATTCDELLLLTRSVRATATSRLAGAGILKVPDELSFVAPSLDGGEPPEDGVDDPLLETLLLNMITPIADPESAAAVVPLMVKGPAEALKALDHLLMERPFDPLAISLREEAVTRLARGLDIPPEILLGLARANHWTAWQIEEQAFKRHIEPLVGIVADGLTVGFLQPILKQSGIPQWAQISVGYDPGDLIGHPNEFPEAMQMHTEMIVSDAYVRSKGGAGDTDTPDEEEYARRIAAKAAIPPEIVTALLEISDVLPSLKEAIVPPPVEAPPAAPEAPAAPTEPAPPASPETTVPGPPEQKAAAVVAAASRADLGGRLATLDRALMARVLGLVETTVQRSVEMIGARIIRALGNATIHAEARDAVRAVPLDQAALVLGRDAVQRLGVKEDEVMLAHLATAEAPFRSAVARTRAEAIRVTRSALGDEPEERWDEDREDQWQGEQDEHTDRAWGFLLGGMILAATTALYDSAPTADPAERRAHLGEMPVETLVPAGTVRDALAEAGGAGASPNVRSADAPPGLVALGDGLLDRMHDAYRQVISGWRWVYGDPSARTRPFEPHEELDGVEFDTWDDDVLSNNEAWPDAAYFQPGDHDGCLCDFEVRLADEGDGETEAEGEGEGEG